jgi:hypothetical protein
MPSEGGYRNAHTATHLANPTQRTKTDRFRDISQERTHLCLLSNAAHLSEKPTRPVGEWLNPVSWCDTSYLPLPPPSTTR